MADEIRVHVVDRGRKFLSMRYTDPLTGRKSERSTGVTAGGKAQRRKADKVAAVWESELREGRYQQPLKVTWDDFRRRYEDELVSGLADRTADKIGSTFNLIEEILSPDRLVQVNADRLARFQMVLRKRSRSENTIKSHLAHLLAALRWAKRVGMLVAVPEVEMPKRAKRSKRMKGRPATGEEFDRMLGKVKDVVGQAAAGSWQHYLRGLWWSGLRLDESLNLSWDDDGLLCVDLTGKYPMLRVSAEVEKGHKDRLLPIAPEFAEFLLATPESERNGYVFNPILKRVKGPRLKSHRVGELVSDIGKAAGVKVHTDPRTGRIKYASAHDLRRSFGERWAPRVMPQVLMELMRHESIETTLRFHVGVNAERTADVLWEAMKTTTKGETLGDRAEESASANEQTLPETNATAGLKE